MPAFNNQTEARAWRETWCARCFQPDEARKRVTDDGPGCPHLQLAERGATPQQWTRRRNAEMGNTYRCADFTKRPPVARKGTVAELPQEELFAVPTVGCVKVDNGGICNCDDARECGNTYPLERNLVPVDGWPDYRAQQRKGGVDHQ